MPPSLPQDSDDNLAKSPELYYTNEGKIKRIDSIQV